MSEQNASNTPFKTLGTHLKYLREQSSQSTSEVSGAVEIDELTLDRYEAGLERPSEDILLLLINYFDMADQEAVQLWELAGYEGEPEVIRMQPEEEPTASASNQKAVVMFLALDPRTMYTDGLDVLCNQAGVNLTFTQSNGQTQPTAVARLGMSYEQAQKVSMALQQALLHAKYLGGPKQLPPTSDTK